MKATIVPFEGLYGSFTSNGLITYEWDFTPKEQCVKRCPDGTYPEI